MVTVEDIKHLISTQNDSIEEFKKKHLARLDALEKGVDEYLLKANRPTFGGGSGGISTSPEERTSMTKAIKSLLAGNQESADRYFLEAKAMSVGSGPDGGYVVYPDISSTMTRVMAEISPLYRLARVVPVNGDAFEEPIDRDAAEAEWVGETAARPDTDTPEIGLFRVPLEEIFAMPKVTQKLIDTASIDIVQWLSGKVGDALGTKESSAFHIGNGVAKPRGFLEYPTATTADASRAWGTVQHIATGASGAFPTSSTSVNPADVLVDVVGSLRAQYRTGAVWLMNRATASAVRKLKDADGRHVWVDSLQIGQPSVLLGYPVEISEDMPDISAGSLSIAFGNFKKGYTIVEKPGIRLLTDPYTDKPNVRLYAYRRVGGGLNNSEAIKLLKFS